MPKKKKQSRKTTQYQRQSVTVNIGTSTKRKRKGGGGGGHRQNLAPTFITAPQVDYTPLLAMMSYQTRSLQQEPLRNPVTPLSSVTQALPAEQMAGEAAIRRAGPTAATFEPVAHMERAEKDVGGGGRVAFSEEPATSRLKLGRPFADLSKLAAAEPVLDPLAIRQTAKVDIREPPARTKSLSFLPTKPPTLSPAVNAAAEQFVPNQASRGRLSSESSYDSRSGRSDSDDEPPPPKKLPFPKREGLLSDADFELMKSLEKKTLLGKNEAKALKVFQSRLKQFPRK
jgi:hypothetical protein